LCVASITAKALQDIETGPFARTDAAQTFTAQYQHLDYPSYTYLRMSSSGEPANQRNWSLQNRNEFVVKTLDDGLSSLNDALILSRTGDAKIYRDLYEKQRTTPIGHWIDVPYNAANFTANTGSWTVPSGNVSTYAYCLIGKTMMLSCFLQGTSTSGGATELRVAIPGGFTCLTYHRTSCTLFDPGYATGMVTAGLAATYLACSKVPPSAFGTAGVEIYFIIPIRLT
jgi:hypothetical protein